jgi:hypothetical protein
MNAGARGVFDQGELAVNTENSPELYPLIWMIHTDLHSYCLSQNEQEL